MKIGYYDRKTTKKYKRNLSEISKKDSGKFKMG